MSDVNVLLFLQVIGFAFLFDNQLRLNRLFQEKNYVSVFSVFLFSFLPTITILSL